MPNIRLPIDREPELSDGGTSMKNSITTKNGDAGHTALYSGEQVSKASARTEACGDIDELSSVLGIARVTSQNPVLVQDIHTLQLALFTVGAELATTAEFLSVLSRRIDEQAVKDLEAKMAELEASIQMPGGFIVPGGSPAAAHLDHARTVARRCERRAVQLRDQGEIDNPPVLVWLNRLSDYLWLLARREEGDEVLLKDS